MLVLLHDYFFPFFFVYGTRIIWHQNRKKRDREKKTDKTLKFQSRQNQITNVPSAMAFNLIYYKRETQRIKKKKKIHVWSDPIKKFNSVMCINVYTMFGFV